MEGVVLGAIRAVSEEKFEIQNHQSSENKEGFVHEKQHP